jgi:ABC-type nitrate/sulfonate/bicarbonate transport system substrate-binding protein
VKICPCLLISATLMFVRMDAALSQPVEKAIITHSSESISITPLIYGIEKGFYRKEGVDLQFRVLRGDLAVSSIVAGRDIDYMYGA